MKKKFTKIFTYLLILISFIALVFFIYIFSTLIDASLTLSLDSSKLNTAKSITILDSNNSVLFDKNNLNNDKISINELNCNTINAFIAIEDKDFFNHNGLNYKRIVKAFITNLVNQDFKEGASTISQQLIKNTQLTNEKTIERKIKEMVLAKKLENTFTKNEILEFYLNAIYYGEGAYGIENASQIYFEKSASQLDLAESATLAGIIKAPATYSPINHLDNCLSRRNLVLKEMLKDKYISDADYKNAVSLPINLTQSIKDNKVDTTYYKSVINEACEILNLSEKNILKSGYKITTYQDKNAQIIAENAIKDENFYAKNSYGNIADGLITIIDNESNGVVAMAKNSSYDLTNLNRQPGSAIKPILVYAPALENGEIYNCSQILDEKTDFNNYSPCNVGNKYYGYVSVREAVAKSLNIPAVKIMNSLTIEKCKNFASNAGIYFSSSDNGLALALGGFTNGINLNTLTNSYTPFINGGEYQKYKFIKQIETNDGICVYKSNDNKTKIMGEDTAYLITDLLKSGVSSGTSKKLNSLNFDIAGKTGTVAVKDTNYNTDAISVAYTSSHSIGVWLGNYTYQKEFNLEGSNNGGTYATAIIKNFCENYYKNNIPKNFTKPSSIVEKDIDTIELVENHNVLLANSDLPDRYTVREIFSQKYLPEISKNNISNYTLNDFTATNLDGVAKVSFSAKKYITYNICVNIDGNEKILDTISNKSELICNNYQLDKLNEYQTIYIKYKPLTKSNYSISNKIKLYVKNTNYDKILDNFSNENNSWIFSNIA